MQKSISGYDNYTVDECGNVFNTLTNRCLKKFKSGNYQQVTLCKDGKKRSLYIHRLVADAFVPNPNGFRQVNHKDENTMNNFSDNLEWCDSRYNCNYGTRNSKIKEANSIPVLCVELQVLYPSMTEAADHSGVDVGNICRCCKGKLRTAGNLHWKYAKNDDRMT